MLIKIGQPYSFLQVGRRENQEDARYPDEDCPIRPVPFFIVCDGVGGNENGEVASSTVCRAFATSLSYCDWSAFSETTFRDALSFAYEQLAKESRGCAEDMATTLTFVAFSQNGWLGAHIGDSRIYHIRPKNGILYRSNDHSLVNALVHSGNIAPGEADTHPDSNVITRCMMATKRLEERAKAEMMTSEDIQPGDYFILCSDGVMHCVSDEKLVEVVESDSSDSEKIDRLARMCAGSPDNNTLYLIPIVDVVDYTEPSETYEIEAQTQLLSKYQYSVKDVVPDCGKTSLLRKILVKFGLLS